MPLSIPSKCSDAIHIGEETENTLISLIFYGISNSNNLPRGLILTIMYALHFLIDIA